jgi:hypothetical protein
MFSQEVADAICSRIASGESLRSAAVAEGTKHPTFLLWCDGNQELADRYARARSVRADVKFEELDDVSEEAANAESAVKIAGLRLKADNIKWMLGKMSPRKYGDVSNVNLSGTVSVRPLGWHIVEPETDQEDS